MPVVEPGYRPSCMSLPVSAERRVAPSSLSVLYTCQEPGEQQVQIVACVSLDLEVDVFT